MSFNLWVGAFFLFNDKLSVAQATVHFLDEVKGGKMTNL